jgi:hypothetical protein
MQYHLEWSDELQAIERKLLDEIESSEKELHPKHADTFTAIILRKIALLNEILGIVESSPSITTEEIAALVDHKLEKEVAALENAKQILDTERICDNLRILERIKYLIIEKNGRVPPGDRLGRLTPSFRQIYTEVMDELRTGNKKCPERST